MRNNTLLKLILFPLLLCISIFAYADASYSKIYIFGDSLSDTGNLGSVRNIPAPYFNNRFSNGPVAVETFTAKLGKTADASLHLIGASVGTNFSVAGSTAIPDVSGFGNDLNAQILAFQVNHGYISPTEALYVIFFGGNDIRIALHRGDPTIAESIINTAISTIKNAINTLYQSGAKHFLIINAPNIALIPETKLLADALNNPLFITQATLLSERFNKKLHNMLESLEEDKEINLIEFDLYKLFTKVVTKSAKFGFTNNTDACFASSIPIPAFHPDCQYGANADQFIFFDEIHPTTRVHAMFGKAFYKALDDNEGEEKEHEESDD